VVEAEEDILVCQEAACYALEHVADALGGDPATRADLAQRVLTRTDVTWSSSHLDTP
jgi:hypothetical protein